MNKQTIFTPFSIILPLVFLLGVVVGTKIINTEKGDACLKELRQYEESIEEDK